MFTLTFAGHTFVPEDPEELPISEGGYIQNGMKEALDKYGTPIYLDIWRKPIKEGGYDRPDSRHLTIVFNCFVVMNIFNMLAAKKINDEFNIFEGLLSNCMFCCIWVFIVLLQAVMVQLGGEPMSCHKEGLTAIHWAICLSVGVSSLGVNVLLKFVPESICPTLGDEDPEDVKKYFEEYKALRRNRDISNSQRFVENKAGLK